MKCTRVTALGLTALALLATTAPGLASASASRATVTVTAGKPSEFGYVLSTRAVARGTVTFAVRNSGTRVHDFRIAGKRTPNLAPGASANLTVTFAKAGSYPYYCTVSGHAAAGMKGALKVT
jgi:uncharacterized cupredoxin-like copper-binding protein